MSIASLTTGDTIIKQTAAHTLGSMGGDSRAYTDGDALDCCVQTDSSQQSTNNSARGQLDRFALYFSADPGLTQNDRIKWTVRAGDTLSTPIYLRVLSAYVEGRPGLNMLWVVNAERDTTRSQQ